MLLIGLQLLSTKNNWAVWRMQNVSQHLEKVFLVGVFFNSVKDEDNVPWTRVDQLVLQTWSGAPVPLHFACSCVCDEDG